MTLPSDVVYCNHTDELAHSKAVACKAAERERRMWLGIRRALFIAIQAIEERYDMPQTRAGR